MNPTEAGPGRDARTSAVRTVVNRSEFTRSIESRRMLADFLRDDLGLRGTKVSCEMRVCGACSVLVDGQPVSACTFLAADIDGHQIDTVEGLAIDGKLHPLQSAFVEHFALQCGFCTPGFLMMAKALLATNPDPSAAEVMEYLEGNICRCTGYEPIIAAVLDAAERIRKGSA